MKRGTLCTKFALAGLGLSSFISFRKKWYIRDEVCGVTKRKEKGLATVRVGHFSLEKRRLKTSNNKQYEHMQILNVPTNLKITSRSAIQITSGCCW